MEKNLKQIEYEITDDPNFMDPQDAITPELKKLLPKYYKMANNGKKSSVKKIEIAIEKYPKSPQLKNYLSVLYSNIGNREKAYETNKWIVEEHPNYLFGKINLAFEYFYKEQYEKIPEILGEAMEITALYPNRNKFHVSEVTSFFKCAVFYYSAIGKFKQAESWFKMLKEVAPDSANKQQAEYQLTMARLKAGITKFNEEDGNKIKVKVNEQRVSSTKNPPDFVHKEIEEIYKVGLYISQETLNHILSLPRETLVKDLESVIDDSIERFAYFKNISTNTGWSEETMNFIVHAVFLLGELEASESIDKIFEMLSQSEEYLDFYFGDFLYEALWEPVYKIVHNEPDKCKQFMFLPGIYNSSKNLIADVFEQVALHQPNRKTEVVNWYRDLINFFLEAKIEDNVIDSDLIAFIICDILDFKAKELLPEIKKLYKKNLVSTIICGGYSNIEKSFLHPSKHSTKKDFLFIADRYRLITQNWASYKKDDSESDYSYNDNEALNPVTAEPKIRRNDPCPCGSGKKYKKCCRKP